MDTMTSSSPTAGPDLLVLVDDQTVADRLSTAGLRALPPPAGRWAATTDGQLDTLLADAPARVVLASADANALAERLVDSGDFPLGLPAGTRLDDPAAVLDALAAAVPCGWEPIRNAAGTAVDLLADLKVRGQQPAIPTGLATLDGLLPGGWVPGLYLLGGMPGRGKTGFGLIQAIGAAKAGVPVLFVSADQGVPELLARLLCSEVGVPISSWWNLRAGDPLFENLYAAADSLPLGLLHFVDDLGAAGIGGLPAVARKLTAQTGLAPFVVVDYLQVLRPATSEDAGEERTRIAGAGDALRQLVRARGLRLLALSSTNRASYHEEPGLEALKGSGDLEFSADAVLLLRDAADGDGADGDGAEDAPIGRQLGEPAPPMPLELHVLKNRFGQRTADRPVLVDFDPLFGTFADRGIAPPPTKKKKGVQRSDDSATSRRDPSPEEVARLCAEAGGWSSRDDVTAALGLSSDRRTREVLARAVRDGRIADEGPRKRPRWHVSITWTDEEDEI